MIVRIPRSFAAERRYIVDVLLGEFLGLQYTVEAGERDYVIEIGSRRLVVRDHFFGTITGSYLDPKYIPDRVGAAIYGNDEMVTEGPELRCGLDLFASAFFMLTRWEETVSVSCDAHDRFLAEHSLAQRAGFLDRCVVNEWTELLWSLLQRLGCTQPRRARTFTVTTSHDVDYPMHWTLRVGAVTTAGDVLKRRSPLTALRTAKSFVATRAGFERDPYDTFDWLMDCSDERGIRSHFNFMTGRWTPHDPPFDYRPRTLARLLERIDRRGHTIGFHPSYNAYNDAALWKLEWDRLSKISPQRITVGREHYLRFSPPVTWQIWDDHGMQWDSTLGYADREGFRCGTCYDYPVFNVHTRKVLKLRERPLIAMDATLVGYRKLAPEDAAASLSKLRVECRKYNGDFMLLWHNSNLSGEWLPYREVYRDALRA